MSSRSRNLHRCAGLQTFLAEGVDVTILEVGLGGRLDATNVVRTPFVCGITALGFDHMGVLGYTLPEIAGEKAGILKPGCPAFTVPQRADAMAVIEVRACICCCCCSPACSDRHQPALRIGKIGMGGAGQGEESGSAADGGAGPGAVRGGRNAGAGAGGAAPAQQRGARHPPGRCLGVAARRRRRRNGRGGRGGQPARADGGRRAAASRVQGGPARLPLAWQSPGTSSKAPHSICSGYTHP